MSEWDDLKHFSKEEFACHHCGENLIELEFVQKLDDIRERLGKPMVITSGYRCPEHNNNISSTGLNGPHTTGRAADIHAPPEIARDLLRFAVKEFPGIGINLKGEHSSRFIHVDQLDYRAWTY